MLTYYFRLQFKLLNRKLIDFGVPLLVAYPLLPFLFVVLSQYLFKNTVYAAYIYGIIALSFVYKLSEYKRTRFLKSFLNTSKYLKLRILENLVCLLPFIIFLVHQHYFWFTLSLIILSVLMSLIQFSTKFNIVIPTPFQKYPFEFITGFRKTFFLFPIPYILTYITITVGNFNLGISSIILIALICVSYYTKPEPTYVVWNFNVSSKDFLKLKIKICYIYFTFLALPIIIVLSITFYNDIDIILMFMMLCYAFLCAMVLAKYTNYPNEISLPQGILLMLCIGFPPMLFVIIPYFYKQAKQRLNAFLNDYN